MCLTMLILSDGFCFSVKTGTLHKPDETNCQFRNRRKSLHCADKKYDWQVMLLLKPVKPLLRRYK